MNKWATNSLIGLIALIHCSLVFSNPLPCYSSSNLSSDIFNTSNVTFRGEMADACAGIFSGNDLGRNGNGPEMLMNAFGIDVVGDLWGLLLESSESSSGNVDGYDAMFILDDIAPEQTSGTWSLSWTGNDLPLELDIAVVIKASTNWVAYLFEDELFDDLSSSASGTWQSVIFNNNNNVQALSHLSVYFSDVGIPQEQIPPNEVQVSSPTPLALLGIGLISLGMLHRRKVI